MAMRLVSRISDWLSGRRVLCFSSLPFTPYPPAPFLSSIHFSTPSFPSSLHSFLHFLFTSSFHSFLHTFLSSSVSISSTLISSLPLLPFIPSFPLFPPSSSLPTSCSLLFDFLLPVYFLIFIYLSPSHTFPLSSLHVYFSLPSATSPLPTS